MRLSARNARLVLAAAMVGGLLATAPTAGSLAATDDTAVIVVLQDQLAAAATPQDTGNRRQQATDAQNAVLGRLAGTAPRNVEHYSLGNAFAATVTGAQAAALSRDPAVASVVPDRKVAVTTPTARKPSGGAAKPKAANLQPPNALCPADPAKPLLEPQALATVHAASADGTPSAADIATGAGVKVAVIADQLDPHAPDFIRPDGSPVFVDYQDFSGTGTQTTKAEGEGFGDASLIAAQGTVVHDLSKFVNAKHPLPAGCTIVLRGVAPDASLVGLDWDNPDGTSDSSILQAIDYAVTVDHVDVINESLGGNVYPDNLARSAIRAFNDQAVRAGVTVVTATGDSGGTSTISNLATDPQVIAVGASTNFQAAMQASASGTPLSNGKWLDNGIAPFSSSGISQAGRTIDLVAPGNDDWAACAPAYSGCTDFNAPPKPTDLLLFGGTSESAPITAGAAALVIQTYRNSHHGRTPTPAMVKELLTGTAHDLGMPSDEQGAGLLDARAAVDAARGQGQFTLSTSQVTFEGASHTALVRVTNTGKTPTTVSAAGRTFRTQSDQTQTIPFDARALPTYASTFGTSSAYKKVTFDVPPGAQRLAASIAWRGDPKTVNGASVTPVVVLVLLTPDGTFATSSQPQSGTVSANFGGVDVPSPVAGKWTAVIVSSASAAGYSGDVQLRTTTEQTVPYGRVTPSTLTLAPGQTLPVAITMPAAATGGDADYDVAFTGSSGQRTVVGAVVRSVVRDTFAGTITGGNGRPNAPSQTVTYEFDVPAGKWDVDVSTQFATGGGVVAGVLIDPHGEAADINSTQGTGLQLTVADPIPGRWRYVIVVQGPVSGTATTTPFTGRIQFDQVSVTADPLPLRLPAGKPTTVAVTVHNTGVEPISVGIDPRTSAQQALPMALTPDSGPAELDVPPITGPNYLVPPETSKITFSGTVSTPMQLLAQSPGAGIEVVSPPHAANPSVVVQEPTGFVGPGEWGTAFQPLGPFGAAGPPVGHAKLTATMVTAGFDPAVTSSTGDPVREPGSPVVIPVGGSATITVTFTPTSSGVVSGHLNVVTVPLAKTTTAGNAIPQLGTGEVLARLPYHYGVS